MLDWLVNSFEIFGIAAQNWMVLVALALAVYAAMLMIGHDRHRTS